LINKKGSLCPSRGAYLDGARVARYDTPFNYPTCNTVLEVPQAYSVIGGWLGVGTAGWLCYSAGLRGFALIVGFFVAVVPITFSIAFLMRHIMPPKVTAISNAASILPHKIGGGRQDTEL
jgi:hypothetical protein